MAVSTGAEPGLAGAPARPGAELKNVANVVSVLFWLTATPLVNAVWRKRGRHLLDDPCHDITSSATGPVPVPKRVPVWSNVPSTSIVTSLRNVANPASVSSRLSALSALLRSASDV